jgi:hypothetical protein
LITIPFTKAKRVAEKKLEIISPTEPTFFLDVNEFNDSLSSATDLDSTLKMARQCGNFVGRLGIALKATNPQLLTNIIIMQQQLNIIQQATGSSSSPSANSLASQQFPPFSSPKPSSTSPTNSIAKILTRPQAFVRSEKRRIFKKKNHGAMTSDEFMEQYGQDEAEKKKAERDKEEKKKQREGKKLHAETLRNIKEEKKDEKDQKKREAEEKRLKIPSPSAFAF